MSTIMIFCLFAPYAALAATINDGQTQIISPGPGWQQALDAERGSEGKITKNINTWAHLPAQSGEHSHESYGAQLGLAWQ